jgi:hypothetical protein
MFSGSIFSRYKLQVPTLLTAQVGIVWTQLEEIVSKAHTAQAAQKPYYLLHEQER